MKRKIAAILFIAILWNGLFAAAEGEISVYVNDSQVVFDQSPLVENGRTLVPIRAIAEMMGAKVEWQPEEQLIVIILGDKLVLLKIDTAFMLTGNSVNGENDQTIQLDAVPKIYNGRTLLPVRAVVEALDGTVEWLESERKINITCRTAADEYQKGILTSDGFESEYIGLRFKLPKGFTMSSGEELLRLVKNGVSYLDEEYIKDYDYATANMVYEMMATSANRTMITLIQEKKIDKSATAQQYIQHVKEQGKEMLASSQFKVDMDIDGEVVPIEIAGQTYYTTTVTATYQDITLVQDYYMRDTPDRFIFFFITYTSENKEEKNSLLNAFTPY